MGTRPVAEHLVSLIDPNSRADLGAEFELEDLPDGRWRLAGTEILDERSMLEGHVQLGWPAGGFVERHPRRLVPMKKDPLLQVFVEVERLGLGEDGLLLCQDGLASIVRDALSQIARPGFQELAPPPGCPDGWTVFEDVQVVAPLSAAVRAGGDSWPIDLNALQPLATSQLLLEGGLQLPGRVRRWSSLAPPEVRAVSEEATEIAIKIDRVGVFQQSVTVLEQQGEAPALIPLSSAMLADGDYEITAADVDAGHRKPKAINVLRLRLRSGDEPNPLASHLPQLARPLHTMASGAISAMPWDASVSAVRGALITPPQQASTAELRPAVLGEPAWWRRRQHARDARSAGTQTDSSRRRISLPPAGPNDCFHTGAHHLDLPTFYGRATQPTIAGTCRYCGLVKRFPARYHLRQGRRGRSARDLASPSFDVASLTPVAHDSTISADVALDALSHDRIGQIGWFEELAVQVEPSRLFVDQFLRALEALAHIEVTRNVRTMSGLSWEVLPPCLVGLPTGGFVLAGQRSRRLVDALTTAANDAGIAIGRIAQGASSPDCIRLDLDSATVAAQLAVTAAGAAATEITVAPNAAYSLAMVLPPLSAVIGTMPRQAMVSARSARKWDAGLAQWRLADDAHVPGCYQLSGAATIYCLRDAIDIQDGTMRRMDARLVKYAAALAGGETMIGYDAATESLYVPLGADLPGLYGRIAVLCSGLLPAEDERQRLTRYPNVPRELAGQLAALLQA
jgi:hypothetical protein